MIKDTINVYCDESCHLENDNISAMAIGSVYLPMSKSKEVNDRIREIKVKHGIPSDSEIKWNKIGPAKEGIYLDIIDYFFDDDDLHFRGLIIPDKSILDHEKYGQSHDDWYYKMFFDLLKVIFDPDLAYNIYMDYKDVYSYTKTQLLKKYICSSIRDKEAKIIKKIQPIKSHEVQLMQIVDVLIGAIAYEYRLKNNEILSSSTKKHLIDRIKKRSQNPLFETTLLKERKFNLLVWIPGKNNYV